MAVQCVKNCVYRISEKITSLSFLSRKTMASSKMFRATAQRAASTTRVPLQHSNFWFLQNTQNQFHSRNHDNDQKNNEKQLHLKQKHSFSTTQSSEDNKAKRRRPLNRFFRFFAVGPKVNYLLEKSGAVEDHSLINLISTSSALAVYSFAAVTAMSYFNIDTTPFVGLFGVGGAAIGFGMKDIANNYVCGVVMALQSLFKRGDEVTVAGSYTGTVQKMNLRHLELETVVDGQKKIVFIPNNDVFSRPITVHRKMPMSAPDAMITEEEQEAE